MCARKMRSRQPAGRRRYNLMPAKKLRQSRFRIALPATSANLGPAFDAAALAMDFYIRIEARPADHFSIVAKGRDPDICGEVENHLILNTYREVLSSCRTQDHAILASD